VGLDSSSVIFLGAARSLGVDFSTTAMIGRQSFWPDAATLRQVFATHGIDRHAEDFVRDNKYAEEFFRLLGAKEIASLDVSPYEHASIIHDMNLPVPQTLHEQFSCVHDGGTIEHVFNIPQAFKNCMEMVKIGGHFTQVNIANNYTGHGFWQFSPELIFRLFTEANGYQIEAVLMHEVIPGGGWYVVSDPDKIRQRVELCNDQPTYVLTIAKRISNVEIFHRPPQQSDYVTLWEQTLNRQQAAIPAGAGARSTTWKRHVPQPLKRAIKSIARPFVAYGDRGAAAGHHQFKRGFDPAAYRRIDEDALLRGQLK